MKNTIKLSEKEKKLLPSSFDMLGDMIIVEIPEELIKKEKLIGEYLLKKNKVKSVFKKSSHFSGVYRTRKLRLLAGENVKESYYKENGAILRVNGEKVYFSTRLANERLRIGKAVKKNENVLIMFAGCAPYLGSIGKNSDYRFMCGIEINPYGVWLGHHNIKINKLKNSIMLNGDVREVMPKLEKYFEKKIYKQEHIVLDKKDTNSQFIVVEDPTKIKKRILKDFSVNFVIPYFDSLSFRTIVKVLRDRHKEFGMEYSDIRERIYVLTDNVSEDVKKSMEYNKIKNVILENEKDKKHFDIKEYNIHLFDGKRINLFPFHEKYFDRIAMPLPMTGEEFLDVAVTRLKNKGIIHLYAFEHKDEYVKIMKDRIAKYLGKSKYQYKIKQIKECGAFSPTTVRVVADIKVMKK